MEGSLQNGFQAGLPRIHILKCLFAMVVHSKSWKIMAKSKGCPVVCADFTTNRQLGGDIIQKCGGVEECVK